MHSRQVDREGVGDSLPLCGQLRVARQTGITTVVIDHREREYGDWLTSQPQPRDRFGRPGAAFERSAHQIGAKPASDVSPRAKSQHV